ncbi:MAG: hypothetical protein WBH00_12155 [Xanthobacteraceae bacterium]
MSTKRKHVYHPPSNLDLGLGTAEVAALLGYKWIGTIYRLMKKDPSFPRPFRTHGGQLRWHQSKVEAYRDSHVMERA